MTTQVEEVTEATGPQSEGSDVEDTSPDAEASAAYRHLPSLFTWVRNVGFVVLLFVAWQLWGTAIGEHQAQVQLGTQFQQLIHAAGPTPTPTVQTLIPASTRVTPPAEGSVLAEIDIPAIGVTQFVVSGTATADLAKGPGHYIGTAAPGQAGNIAIAGHRTTHGAPFNRLGNIVIGDKIILTDTKDQHFTYVVSEAPFAISPSNTTVLGNFGDNRITLTTCTPEFSAAQRLIVVGELVLPGHKLPLRPAAQSVPYHVVNAATASWRWALLPIVLLETAALVLLGLFNRRLVGFYGRVGGWLFLTPIWIAGLCVLFQTLTTFFPPSL